MKILSCRLLFSQLSLIAFFSLPMKSYAIDFQDQAYSWLYTYIFMQDGTARISTYDIKATVNLIYLSWCRSTITVQAQKEALQTLDIMWKGWQNISQTRLDPGVDLPYAILPEQQESAIRTFWIGALKHRSIGVTYSYAVKMILEKQIVQSLLALDGIADMRNRSRSVVLESLIDIRKQLGEFFHIKIKRPEDDMQEPYNVLPTSEKRNPNEDKNCISLLDYIYAYIPHLALHSFVEANNMNNLVSEEGWLALKTIQEIGNQTWNAIEEARADFYRAYYTVLVSAIKQYGLSGLCLQLMFNQHGIIPENAQHSYLPEPTALDLPSLEILTSLDLMRNNKYISL